MLIVGGTAAATAILVYLTWYFVNRWRATARLRRAERRERIAKRHAESAGTTRELVS